MNQLSNAGHSSVFERVKKSMITALNIGLPEIFKVFCNIAVGISF